MELAEPVTLPFAGQKAEGTIALLRGNSDFALASHVRDGDSSLPCRQVGREGKPSCVGPSATMCPTVTGDSRLRVGRGLGSASSLFFLTPYPHPGRDIFLC